MADFITTSIDWAGKETFNKIIQPQFIGKSPFETQGVKIFSNVQDKQLLNYFGSASKLIKAYAQGFSASAGVAYTQRQVDVYQMEAEMEMDANVFKNTVYNQLQGKGVDWNDVSKMKGEIPAMIVDIFKRGIDSDIYRQFWFNDVYKETVLSGVQTGTADVNYNAYNGMWYTLFANSAASPTSSQIKAFDIDNSAVKQVQTATLTGTSGTCNVVVEGVNYLATFATSLTVTCTNFVTTHAAALLLRGLVVTSSTDTLIFTSTVPGWERGVITVSAAVSGDLTGSVAQTTANTAPANLSADDTLGYLKTMYADSPATLKGIAKNRKVFLMDGDLYANYETSLEGTTSTAGQFTSEAGRKDLIAGVEMLKFRGIPVINLDWEVFLEADFPHVTGENPARNNRIIYTELDNLLLLIDNKSEFNKFEFWYNKDLQLNRYRLQMKAGANYVSPEVISVAYEI